MDKSIGDKTIGNPLTWTARQFGATSSHIAASTEQIGGEAGVAAPRIKTLTTEDLRDSLRDGWDDFLASRADAIFLILIYPVAGLILIGFGMQMDLVHLLFPMLAGFALLGPIAAVGLYEISRRREAGEAADWRHAFRVIESPSFSAIVVLGLYLSVLFLFWMFAAHAIHQATMGPDVPGSISGFVREVLTTSAGWTMIVLGIGAGLVFALAVLALSIVSFPLLLDRHVGVPVAIVTSVRVFQKNPRVVLTWGAIVAAGLVLGSLPLLLGLIVVMPVLGHATWHLYRRAVE